MSALMDAVASGKPAVFHCRAGIAKGLYLFITPLLELDGTASETWDAEFSAPVHDGRNVISDVLSFELSDEGNSQFFENLDLDPAPAHLVPAIIRSLFPQSVPPQTTSARDVSAHRTHSRISGPDALADVIRDVVRPSSYTPSVTRLERLPTLEQVSAPTAPVADLINVLWAHGYALAIIPADQGGFGPVDDPWQEFREGGG